LGRHPARAHQEPALIDESHGSSCGGVAGLLLATMCPALTILFSCDRRASLVAHGST
jgi:hypothetical protein